VLPAHVALVRELFIDRVDPADLPTVRDALARVAQLTPFSEIDGWLSAGE
jgi:hypothetical protein